MKFSEIIGQENVKERLYDMIDQGKVPHALMFTGIEGCGILPLAISFAQKLLCQGKGEDSKKSTYHDGGSKSGGSDLFGGITDTSANTNKVAESVSNDLFGGQQGDLFGGAESGSNDLFGGQQGDLFGGAESGSKDLFGSQQGDLFGVTESKSPNEKDVSVPKESEGSEELSKADSEVEEVSHEQCGTCKSCLMSSRLQHPDLHFMFPIYKKPNRGAEKPTYCDEYLEEWRDLVLSNPYFSYSDWMEAIGAENQQLTIYESESDAIFKKLSLVASQGGNKVCVIWLPEKMNATCANKILKLLEEPPANTYFILASVHPDQLLQTIRSRVQTMVVPPLSENEISSALENDHKILPALAKEIAHTSHGDMASALKIINDNSDNEMYFELFVRLMRLSYVRKVKEMRQWSEEVAKLGRERIRRFLAYCQHMIRENFIYNFHLPELNYMSSEESNFAVKFAPFINENNVIGIMNELSLCSRDIGQNANAKIVMFDFSLKMIVLIKNR